jgi:hypothetical protein
MAVDKADEFLLFGRKEKNKKTGRFFLHYQNIKILIAQNHRVY